MTRNPLKASQEPAREAVCTCGCVFDDHGHDDEYPGSTACQNCGDDCVAFEEVIRDDE